MHNQLLILLGLGVIVLTLARRLPRFALSRPIGLLMSLVALGLSGILAFQFMPVELMPNSSFGVITITTPVRGGMAPLEIEKRITTPIEKAVAQAEHARRVISNSKKNKSTVSIEFESGTEMDFATLDVREKFSKVRGDLPRNIENPIIAHYRESDVPIFIFALTSQSKSPEELRRLIEDEVQDSLLRVSGVANVELAGGRERKIIVDVDRYQLAAHNMNIETLVSSLEQSNLNIRAGSIKTEALGSQIRAIGQFENVEEIENTVIGVSPQGSSVYLKNVAKIRDSYLERESLSRLNAKSAVTVYIQKESGANTLQIVKRIQERFDEFKPTLDQDIQFVEISNQGKAIHSAIQSVRKSLGLGMILVVLILGLFLGFRSSIIVAISIPVTVLMAGCFMYLNGLSINVMSLSGLALAIGLLVDNSIVILERIHKQKKIQDIVQRSEKVIPALVGGTLTTLIVFVPFVLLSKKIQILFSGVAITITIALFLSLYVALTTVPYLVNRWMGEKDESKPSKKASSFIGFLSKTYSTVLPMALQQKSKVILALAGLFLVSVYVFQFRLEKNLLSGSESNEFVVFVELPSGKQLDISNKIVKEVEEKIRNEETLKPFLDTISTRVDGWSSKIYVSLVTPDKRNKTVAQIIDEVRPLIEGIGEAEEAFIYFSSPQSDQEITVNIYGHEAKVAADYAMQVASFMGQTSGFKDARIRYRPGRPEVQIRVRPERAALFGLDANRVGRILHAQTRGLRATYFREEGQEVETIVRLKAHQRESVDSLKSLLIPTQGGKQIPLLQLAEFEYVLAPSEIWRIDKERVVQVTANIPGQSIESAAEKVKSIISEIPFNSKYWAEVGGDYQDRIQAQKDFRWAFLVTVLLLFVVLACLFESMVQPLLLMVSVPFSMIGVVTALYLTGTAVTMGTLIGMLLVCGIALNHSILFMDQFNANKLEQSKISTSQRLIETGLNRLKPILLTTLTTVLGLVPMALDQSNGADLWRPMAITAIGGLLGSFVLTLIGLPTIIAWAEERKKNKMAKIPKKSKEIYTETEKSKTFQRAALGLLLFGFLFSLTPPSYAKQETDSTLPKWVDDVVEKRVRDLIDEGRHFEKRKEYVMAIESFLDAVRLDPKNIKARKHLKKANHKSWKKTQKEFQKKRKQYVSTALEQHRANKAHDDSIRGKIVEAEKYMGKGRLLTAIDRFERVLEEEPKNVRARRGLDQSHAKLSVRLDKGGGFRTEDHKKVGTGFYAYLNNEWKKAIEIWDPYLKDEKTARKWSGIRLGHYRATAYQSFLKAERDQKIDDRHKKALLAFRNGDLTGAEKEFQEIVKIDPYNQSAKEYLEIIPGLLERAREKVLNEVEEKQMAQTLSDALDFYLKGFYDEAEAKLKLVLDKEPDHKQALALANDIRNARGLPKIPTTEEIATARQLELEKRYTDGIEAFADGRYKAAREAWSYVVDEDPRHDRAVRALKKLEEIAPVSEN